MSLPTKLHEALVDVFRYDPSMAVTLVAEVRGIALSDHHRARLDTNDAGLRRSKHRADAVVLLDNAHGRPEDAIVVEVQLDQDGEKYWTWPAYVVAVRSRGRSRTTLLVICVSDAVARWAMTPIPVSVPDSLLMFPVVVGPEQMPILTDPNQARRRPMMAVLSALIHQRHPDLGKILDALLDGVDTLEEHEVERHLDIVYAGMTENGRHDLESRMTTQTYQYQGAFLRRLQQRWAESRAEGRVEGLAEGRVEGRVEGRAEGIVAGLAEGRTEGEVKGKAEALLVVLRSRHVDISPEVRARILGCTELDQLTIWVDRAANATSIEEVFG